MHPSPQPPPRQDESPRLPDRATVRLFRPEEAEFLADVYRDSVRAMGPQAYSPEQVAMWARYPEDISEFQVRMAAGLTLVAEVGNRIVAFGQLEPCDHLALLYCRGCAARQGLGSRIYLTLEAHAFANGVTEIRTEASRISRPFFAKHGFVLCEVERVMRHGVEFERFRMKKRRAGAPSQGVGGAGPERPGTQEMGAGGSARGGT